MVGTGAVFLYLKDSEAFLQYLEAGWSESENAYTLYQLGQAGTMFILPHYCCIKLGNYLIEYSVIHISSNRAKKTNTA